MKAAMLSLYLLFAVTFIRIKLIDLEMKNQPLLPRRRKRKLVLIKGGKYYEQDQAKKL